MARRASVSDGGNETRHGYSLHMRGIKCKSIFLLKIGCVRTSFGGEGQRGTYRTRAASSGVKLTSLPAVNCAAMSTRLAATTGFAPWTETSASTLRSIELVESIAARAAVDWAEDTERGDVGGWGQDWESAETDVLISLPSHLVPCK